jgi:high-affinity iron transporter
MVLGQYLITFREVLEAALITSMVLAYLTRTGRNPLTRYVWYGVISAMVASVALGATIWWTYGILPESTQVLFEGMAALIAVAVLSSMLYWMATKGKELRAEVEKKVEILSTRGAVFGLVSFAFVAVFREGLETVLFLTPYLVNDSAATVAGLLLGTLTSLALAYVVFFVGKKINVRRFFYFTSILLVLLAGGLAGYGVHELIEYTGSSAWGWLGQNAYVLSISPDSLFHHKGIIGSVFAVMFGYTVRAEWARLMVHFAYLAVAIPLVVTVYRKR